MSSILRDYRCPECNKLLFRGLLVGGEVEIKCPRCRDVRILTGEKEEPLLCYKPACANRVTLAALREQSD